MKMKDRFMKHVHQTDGCWTWTAYCMKNGYGLFRMPDRHYLAHRISHEIFNGAIPKGMDVMHSCDNRSCVNPRHLSVGTRLQNMSDAKSRNRLARGEKHGRRKLTENQAKEVFSAEGFQKEIAERFGISQTIVSQIKAGKRWSHLTNFSA